MRRAHLELNILACLACGGDLRLAAGALEDDGHIMTGALLCRGCERSYPIVRGVPRMTPSQQTHDVSETVGAFGFQWKHTNDILKRGAFSAQETFLDFIAPVQPDFFRDKVVLDGGCGIGRFTIWAAKWGAKLAIGVDLSESVDVAFDNTRHMPNVVIVQGDMLALPVQPKIDYAFSVAVLHHTADPRGAFLHMATKVRPGGSVSAWVYGRENNGWIVHVINPLRTVTSRIPRQLLYGLAHVLAVPMWLATKGLYAPISRHGALRPLRRVLFYFDYMVFLAQFSFREQAIIIFDHAVPAIAEYIRRDAFAEWFDAARLEQIVITMRGGNSWRGFARVPQQVMYATSGAPRLATPPTPTTTPTGS